MSKPFIDSNVVLYLLSGDISKADRAQSLLAAGAIISVQVLNEVASVCLRKLKMPWPEIDDLLMALKATCEVVPLTVGSQEKAVALAQKHQISVYDANIVACAVMSGANLLFTEDMHPGLQIDNLVLKNPFK